MTLIGLFGFTLFANAAILFAVEPLIAKSLLPVLGGGAAVWTTTAAFFQLALLGGYWYAHVGPAWLGTRRHAWLHAALLLVAAVVFGRTGGVPESSGGTAHPALWLFWTLARTVGPPFVLLAASTPLLHLWLASTARREARDPYFLFAASNAGSLVALLAYPVLIEPALGLARQRQLWSWALFLLLGLLAACAALASRPSVSHEVPPPASTVGEPRRALGWQTRARWVALSAVPASLLLSLTSYATIDLAALPLLWVIPLALYLTTFIVAFGRRALVAPARVLWLQPFFLLPVTIELFLKTAGAALPLVPLHAVCFFLLALGCHQALAASRPEAGRSTEFYLWVAAGGAAGGLFNVFVAPAVFPTLLEYPLGLVAAALLRPPAPPSADGARARRLDVALPLALGAVLLGATSLGRWADSVGTVAALVVMTATLCLAGAGVYAFRARPWRFGLALLAICGAGLLHTHGDERVVYRARSFYAVHTVSDRPPTLRTLSHGNTVHGAQDRAPERRGEPLTYYHRTGPIGGVMAAWAGRPLRQRVGIVGLGAGALAAYSAPSERWTFFEIDPVMVDIARDRGLFTYLADARGRVDVVLGDARQTLADVPDGAFGVLVLDAFSSDSIPAHLLTREALTLYLRKLAPGGVIAFHLSNRYLDLEPVVSSAAGALGLVSLTRGDFASASELVRLGKSSSLWLAAARTAADLAPLMTDPRWVKSRVGLRAWTDDRSDLWHALHLRASQVFGFSNLSRRSDQ